MRATCVVGVLTSITVASCGGGDDSASPGDAGSSGDGSANGDGGGTGDAAPSDGGIPKPGKFLFAKTIPAAAGPIVALPGGGWAAFVEILHSTVIAGTTITRSGRDDAALVKLDANGDPVWAAPMIGPGDDNRSSLAVDEAGNIYVAGLSLNGQTMDFGNGVTTANPDSANAYWGWFAKFDANGTAQWASGVGADLGLFSIHIAAQNGKVVVTGFYSEPNLHYYGTSGVVAAPAFGNYPVFVLSCGASDGLVTSMARLDGTETESGVVIDSSGRAIVTGTFINPKVTKEPTGDVVSLIGKALNTYAVAFDSASTMQWARAWGSTEADGGIGVEATNVATDHNGHVVLGGTMAAAVDFGGGRRSVIGPSDPFALSIEPTSGTFVWDKELATSLDDPSALLSLDPNGNVVTAETLATAAAPTAIDGVPLPTTPGTFVGKLAPAPTLAWIRHTTVDSPSSASVASIAANGSGQVAVTGTVVGTVDFGGGPIEESDSGFDDMFVLGVADP